MYDYGNARIAALRSRLLDPEALHHLAEAGTPAALLVQMERLDDWRPILRELGPLAGRPRAAIELAIEQHRSARLRALSRMYDAPDRAFVEALVMALDLERVLEVLRRRRAGESGDSVAATASGGALLGERAIAVVARASSVPQAVRLLGRLGLIGRPGAKRLAAAFERDGDWSALEAGLLAEAEATRKARTVGRGPDAALAHDLVLAEHEARAAIADELAAGAIASAAVLERERTLARLDALAARSRRDPLGLGAAAGYVAAVEAQAIRLRAVVARVADGWSRERTGAWLAVGA